MNKILAEKKDMDWKDIDIIIKEGEGLSVEFKERYSSKIDEDIVAFSNTKGGVIILGVNDDKKIVGEKLTNELKARINNLARNCKPSIDVFISQIGNVVVIDVSEGNSKPYSCSTGYFRRLDGNTQKMSHEELRIMFNDHDKISFEEKRIKNFDFKKDISNEKIKAFTKEANVALGKTSNKDFLTSLNLIENDEIKNAGILMFTKDVRKYILQAEMQLIAFKGKDNVNIYDRIDVRDDLLTQFKEAMIFIKKHLNLRSEIKGVNRKDILEIPEEALREAVVNAVIHRDYSFKGTSLTIHIYDDRIEITNPGGLPSKLPLKDFGKVSVRRNELIADLFARMDKVERAGTGIEKMERAMKDANLTKPKFEISTFFRSIFYRPVAPQVTPQVTPQVKFTELESKIIAEIKTNSRISRNELAKKLGISADTIKEYLEKLKSKGMLVRIGKTSAGYWEVKE